MQVRAAASASSPSPDDPNNAYIDKALTVPGAAEGPLKGLTFAVKDLFDVGVGPTATRIVTCVEVQCNPLHTCAAFHTTWYAVRLLSMFERF